MDDNPHRSSTRKRKVIAYTADEDDDAPSNYQPPRKKERQSKSASDIIDLTGDSPQKTPRKKGKRDDNAPAEEKRSRQFRKRAPQSYLTIKERALTQRLTVLSRERYEVKIDDTPREKIVIAGSTGNVYTVHVGLVPKCDCPHARLGNQCKHIIYVMLRVLKAQEQIAYQLALIPSELRIVLQNAPPIPGFETDGKGGTEKDETDRNRKPIEGECPICYDELGAGEAIVYCKLSCGNNVHKDCMQKWTSISKGTATCPYCRAKWAEETGLEGKLGTINTKNLAKNADGYVNVAGQLGLNAERDHSTYHQPWVRGQHGYGGRRRGGFDYDDGWY